ncbi:MAG: MBL fold metallo-hydrolase [Clostridia bacterium]|nr:MBL fold metallo-hydrolase [Clostridia bacterium]
MKKIEIPAFGEARFEAHVTDRKNVVYTLSDAEETLFDSYAELFVRHGFTMRERRERENYRYAAYFDGTDAYFLNYYAGVKELMVIAERETAYFSYSDQVGEAVCTPQVTQVKLEDYGMSYAIRLSDRRFIVIDGGWAMKDACDNLYECLTEDTNGEKPVIAAWILTHPHPDHYHCFDYFMERHENDVIVEKVMFNFPEYDDLEHYPHLTESASANTDTSAYVHVPIFLARLEKLGAPVYKLHTGQVYRIGDAVCEILVSMDDTIHLSQNLNAISVVIRMELAGQVILWTTDASFSIARIPEKVGSYLKSDILQIPHHGFQMGLAPAEIEGYRLIAPRVCFLPVSDINAYSAFCTHREGTAFLMTDEGVEEILTGEVRHTIDLPYTPPKGSKHVLREKFLVGRDTCGSCSWIFCGLSTDRPEDLVFSILNTEYVKTTVTVELFFEKKGHMIRYLKTEALGASFHELDLLSDEVNGDFPTRNPSGKRIRNLPPNTKFAIRFLSKLPIVVWHPDHKPAYVGSAGHI